MVKIKNATTNGNNTFDKIQKVLSSHGANKIMYDYDENGLVNAITFGMKIGEQQVGFKLPALVNNVYQIMYKDVKKPNSWVKNYEKIIKDRKDQAYKTAWANIRDWIDAQMALIDTEQVKMEQVFLPYAMGNDGKTFSEKILENPKFLLGGDIE